MKKRLVCQPAASLRKPHQHVPVARSPAEASFLLQLLLQNTVGSGKYAAVYVLVLDRCVEGCGLGRQGSRQSLAGGELSRRVHSDGLLELPR